MKFPIHIYVTHCFSQLIHLMKLTHYCSMWTIILLSFFIYYNNIIVTIYLLLLLHTNSITSFQDARSTFLILFLVCHFVGCWKLFAISRSGNKFKRKIRLFIVQIFILLIHGSHEIRSKGRRLRTKANILDIVSKHEETESVPFFSFSFSFFFSFSVLDCRFRDDISIAVVRDTRTFLFTPRHRDVITGTAKRPTEINCRTGQARQSISPGRDKPRQLRQGCRGYVFTCACTLREIINFKVTRRASLFHAKGNGHCEVVQVVGA